MLWISAALAAAPGPTTFTYVLTETVVGEAGVYSGYRDNTRSDGTYTLGAGDPVEVHAVYAWKYASTEGEKKSGKEDRTVHFSTETRRYLDGMDLDDPLLARLPPGDVATWMWIDPASPAGPIRVLDRACELTGRDIDPPFRRGVTALQVVCDGRYRRDDDYGQFDTTFHDTYWFDAVTGLILGERYQETNEGSLRGEPGRFELRQVFVVTEAPYAPPIDVPPEPAELVARGAAAAAGLGLFGLLGGAVVGLAALMGVVWWANRPPPEYVQVPGHGTVQFRPLTDAHALAGLDLTGCSVHFAPFLEDFAARAVLAKDPAWIAVSGSTLVGFAWVDRAARVGTVFAQPEEVVKGFVRRGLDSDFFSEHRHQRANGGPLYNVQEGWTLLERRNPVVEAFDTSLVRPVSPSDRRGVLEVLNNAFGQDLGVWLSLQLSHGDLGYVAVLDGEIVGFALATVSGADARLTLSAVAPKVRDRGIGSELVRARLTALAHLGVERVLVEVADWNLAPRHVLQKHGFTQVGTLVLETTRVEQTRRAIVRR